MAHFLELLPRFLKGSMCLSSSINADSVPNPDCEAVNQNKQLLQLTRCQTLYFHANALHQHRHFSTQSESKPKPNDIDRDEKASVLDENCNKGKAIIDNEGVKPEVEGTIDPVYDVESEELQKMSLWQRYKIVLKQYGKVMIPVHLATSTVWYGSFYYIVKHSGIDMIPYIEKFLLKIGFGESIIHQINSPTASGLLIAYAMYKIATPARYTVTLMGTSYSVRYLRRKGFIAAAPPKDKTLREAVKESMDDMKDRSKQMIEKKRRGN
uniref:Uncharacterized protein C18orf19 homolog A-like n=1 Tax=Saccoglossus kowalevskii TaxID=10224 RepID=A0ABM0N1D8_SACKO|nr:PREDICTED: uncharacterized protein C18orf19 homolog A-like [Saccoglossus kowalevskii]